MIAVMLLIMLVGVGLIVMMFFLPSKKAPTTGKESAAKEIAKGTISKLEAEGNSLRMELEKEQLKSSALQGEVNAAKETEAVISKEL